MIILLLPRAHISLPISSLIYFPGNSMCFQAGKSYGQNRSRTDDLFLAREARYQLRHLPTEVVICCIHIKLYPGVKTT